MAVKLFRESLIVNFISKAYQLLKSFLEDQARESALIRFMFKR